MSRQHAAPVLVPTSGPAIPLSLLGLGQDGHGWSEAEVQALIHAHPACLPIAEIDPLFAAPVPICTELGTTAGAIDNLLVTASGLPVLVECKLWRNPQARREVVGQILDYAKELSRWSSSDLQREARRRLGRGGDPVLELVRAAGHEVEEIAFNDALTLNLRRGRFLLLIVGDGIREGVEAIAEYLQAHAGLHFTLGLVELPIFATPDGGRLVAPRVVARTTLITREVVALPTGFILQSVDERGQDPDEADGSMWERRAAFMREVAAPPLDLDPEQPTPQVTPKGWLFLYLPAPASSCWVSVLLKDDGKRVGVRLTSNAGTIGEAAIAQVVTQWTDIAANLNGSAVLREGGPNRFIVEDFLIANIADPRQRAEAVAWLRSRLRDFVTVFRPRIRDAVANLTNG